MTLWRYVARTLVYHWRINAAVALSVAAATAVLTGALVVGDSVRSSLSALTLDRLGRIDDVLVTDRFFPAKLAEDLAGGDGFEQFFDKAVPAIIFSSATVERSKSGQTTRASQVLVVGCTGQFGDLDRNPAQTRWPVSQGQIVLNQPLAEDLGASVGDEVVLRLPKSNQVPADSPMASKSDRIRGIGGLRVTGIIPARGLGQFSLRPRQTVPRNAYVSAGTIQEALAIGDKVNAILVSGKESRDGSDAGLEAGADRALQQSLRPSFEDYGLELKHVRRLFPADGSKQAQAICDYYSLTTGRLVFSPDVERVLDGALAELRAQPVFTYLSNNLALAAAVDAKSKALGIPYSMVAAIDPSDSFPLRDVQGRRIDPLSADEMVLTDWAARDLGAKAGDRIRMEFFAPETTHGRTTEIAAEFRVKAITPLTEPAQPYRRNREAVYDAAPSLANDPDLTPTVKGVTDQETIDDWDAPFPFEHGRVRKQDETYWSNHRTTPKAFVSLAAGQKLWGSRFGRVTSFRIPANGRLDARAIQQRVASAMSGDPAASGLAFTAVKRQQLNASKGTTPFDVLFLSLSFFIIVSALMLVALLFRLSVEQRAQELGTLLAIGLRWRRAGRLLLAEGAAVAAAGGLAGVWIGIAYAKLMLYGLRTWWLGATTAPFVQYFASERSLASGYLAGVAVCVITIAWTVRGVRRIPARRLLAGQMADEAVNFKPSRWGLRLAVACTVLAIGLLVGAARLSGMSQAGAFVGGGALLLTGSLLAVWWQLKRGGAESRQAGRLGLIGLAWRNAARNPLRSTITIGLMSSAVFLIVATSSFRLAPSEKGVGGFDWLAESSEPVFANLNDPAERTDLLGDQAGVLQGTSIFGVRVRGGDDASCNNLYQPAQPRVLGFTEDFVHHFDTPRGDAFAWSSSAARSPADRANPWRLLSPAEAAGDGAIPAVVDMNTAFYSLKPPVTVGSVYEASYGPGRSLRFRIVGLLENSVLQGALLIGEKEFERAFPDVSGYRFFLIRGPRDKSAEVARVLEDQLSDEGFDATRSRDVLAQLMAVQNAYLSTFQSLGALGLLLGTLGLAAVQWRNVVERRGELALLRATGFGRRRLLWLVLSENVALLALGLSIGAACALAAVMPHKSFGEGAIPPLLLRDLAAMVAVVFLVGLLASFISVAAALRAPLLASLRQEN